jgi:hypothetical protein
MRSDAPADIPQWHVELISPLYTAFFDTHTAPPTKDELDALMIEIRVCSPSRSLTSQVTFTCYHCPGHTGRGNSKDRNVQQWFWHRYSEKAREGAPVEEKANRDYLI